MKLITITDLGTGPVSEKPTLQERIDRIGRIIEANPPAQMKPPRPAPPPARRKPIGAKELQARRDREERMKQRQD